ncbi:hypothetical protein [Nocardia rhizosphaerihabitans]|uniref:hypothetical protein n=1 Tax=Nocardia rhizosphaerihabitans TaxID=1691570 RepID=UPI001E5E8374|nr:hypothetical protein [Nocardia rhizosphaerihabitans]
MTSLSIVIDQHNEEATFLAGLRDLAVHAPHYATWRTCSISTSASKLIWMLCR